MCSTTCTPSSSDRGSGTKAVGQCSSRCARAAGVLHTLEGSRLAVRCLPERPELARAPATRELDHVLAAVFGLWAHVVPKDRLFPAEPQLSFPLKGPKKVEPRSVEVKKSADGEG
jgi:hypothetical protein